MSARTSNSQQYQNIRKLPSPFRWKQTTTASTSAGKQIRNSSKQNEYPHSYSSTLLHLKIKWSNIGELLETRLNKISVWPWSFTTLLAISMIVALLISFLSTKQQRIAQNIVKHTSLGSSFFFIFSVQNPERTPVITRFGASNDSLTPVCSLPGSSLLWFSSDPGFRWFPAHEVSHLSSSHGQCEQTTHYPDRFPVAASGRVSRCFLRFVDNKKKTFP